MLFNAGKLSKIFYFYIIKLLLLLPTVKSQTVENVTIMATASPSPSPTTERSRDFTNNLLNLLNQCEGSAHLTVNTVFGVLISQFIIKESVRHFEPTRYEEQLYANIMQHLGNIISKANNDEELNKRLKPEHRIILKNIFQRNVQINQPKIKMGQINTHVEFRSLAKDYKHLVSTGFPHGQLSDFCLAKIVSSSSDACDIDKECIDVIVSDLPTYGYQRAHQILLLYVFMHHKCAQIFGSTVAYEILASQRCTQVYREQNVIRSLGIPAAYKDLYLEQNMVCGLLGFAEFLNWRSVDLMLSWPHAGDCLCQVIDDDDNVTLNDCECTNHINSLAIVYLTNALLLLN